MKSLLIVVALAGIAYLGMQALASGSAQERLYGMISSPSAVMSKLSFDGGSLATFALIMGAAFIVLAIAYAVRSK